MIISDGQALHHEFIVKNPSDRPIRLLGAIALTPCCSAVGPLPESIPPRGVAKIPTVLKPGFQSGPKRLLFVIETDSKTQPTIGLSLQVLLVSAWEAVPVEGSSAVFRLGRAGKLTFCVIARRRGSAGRDLPERISAAPPVDAGFAGRAEITTGSEGSIEAARDVVVSIPAANQPGIKRGELLFHWPDGRTDRMPLSWEVRPRLRVLPAGLVLRRSAQPVEREIVIASDGLPFRVTGVASSLLARPVDLAASPGIRHTIPIKPDLTKVPPNRTASVTITTNHPDQASAELSVLVLPDPETKGGRL